MDPLLFIVYTADNVHFYNCTIQCYDDIQILKTLKYSDVEYKIFILK